MNFISEFSHGQLEMQTSENTHSYNNSLTVKDFIVTFEGLRGHMLTKLRTFSVSNTSIPSLH